MKRLFLGALLLLLSGVVSPAHAAGTTTTGVYPAGWSMVGGPPGTDFSSAAVLYAYDPASGTYVTPGSRQATLCQGYWAYFNASATVPLAAPISASTQSCALQAGWNLVGNPFTAPALLPAGTTAYTWNPARGAYDLVSAIQPGASAWVYTPAPSSIVLVNSAAPPTTVPPNLLINSQNGIGPYTVHVGNTIRLIIPSTSPSDVTINPAFLRLDSAGYTTDMSCIGDPACQINPLSQYYDFTAIAAGTTYIAISPRCLRSVPPCAAPTQAIQINILP